MKRLLMSGIIGTIIASFHAGVHKLFIPFAQFEPTGSLTATIGLALVLSFGIYIAPIVGAVTSGISKIIAGFFLWILHAVVHDGIHLLYGATLEFGAIGVPESGITVAVLYGIALIYFMK